MSTTKSNLDEYVMHTIQTWKAKTGFEVSVRLRYTSTSRGAAPESWFAITEIYIVGPRPSLEAALESLDKLYKNL